MKSAFSYLLACVLALAYVGATAQTPAVRAEDAWVRATPGSDVAAAYLTLINVSKKSITLIGVESSAASMAMIHETTLTNGISRMRAHEQLVIAPGATVKLEPDGLHIMLHGFSQPLSAAKTVPLVLRLSDGTSLHIEAPVRPLGAR